MKDFRTLKVWQKAHDLTLLVYRLTSAFPKDELYTLTAQMRRSSASIPTNIAEGCGRKGNAEFHRFLAMGSGSASELEYQLILARDLRYVTSEQYVEIQKELLETRRMLTALILRVEASRASQ